MRYSSTHNIVIFKMRKRDSLGISTEGVPRMWAMTPKFGDPFGGNSH